MIVQHQQPLSYKHLVLFLDGTWNKPDNHTNVYRQFLMLSDTSADGVRQEPYYNAGVGTRWFDRVSGGAFGWGLSDNVCQAYRWLMEKYNEGDKIFLFGFSRGAFTARSLAGLIARCGLLKPDAAMSFRQLYERYQRGRNATPIYELLHQRRMGRIDFDFEERVLLDHAWYGRNLIKMVGVWDTVGSIGVPAGTIPGISRRTLRFHNTRLSTIVEHSYQALALDEHRKPYWGMLWTNFIPHGGVEGKPHEAPAVQSEDDDRMIEQRWFSGAHCDVGGGYRNDVMSHRPLAWLQQKAMACQLGFRSVIQVDEDEDLQCTPHKSYEEFMGGIWRRLSKRYVRWVRSDRVRKKEGWVHTVNERLDPSIFERCRRHPSYRPASLKEWAARKRLDLETVISQPPPPELTEPVTGRGVEPADDQQAPVGP